VAQLGRPPGTRRLEADREWIRWGVAAAVTGMLAWVAGVALIPLDAKLDKGNQHLAQVLRAHSAQLYAAVLACVSGPVEGPEAGGAECAAAPRWALPPHPGWGSLRDSEGGCW